MIALLAIMLNEAEYAARWAAAVQTGPFAEIVVVDGGSTDDTAAILQHQLPWARVLSRKFPDDFADQRNFAIEQTQCPWIMELDADERLSVPLLREVVHVVHKAEAAGFDCIGLPRLNFHDGVLQPPVGPTGLDFQYRLHRRHVRWELPVHEVVTGWQKRSELEIAEGYFIKHDKSQVRYEERNRLYDQIAGGDAE